MKNRRGEIATILTLGAFVIIGIATVATSFTQKDKKTTSSRASAPMENCINSIDDCNKLIKMGECPAGNIATTCIKFQCRNGKYRCPGTVDDSPVTVSPAATCKGVDEVCNKTTMKCCSNAGTCIKNEGEQVSTCTIDDTVIPPTVPVVPPTDGTLEHCPKGKGGSGNKWECDATLGYNETACPKLNLEFDCCYANGNKYGCVGTHCSAIGNGTEIVPCSSIVKPEVPSGGAGGPEDPNCKAGSGNRFACDPTQGYNKSICEADNMEFACCIAMPKCTGGELQYRWYGCTGQPCANTNIKNPAPYNTLVACPNGMDKSSPDTGTCASELPQVTPEPEVPDGCEISTEKECTYIKKNNETASYTYKDGMCCLNSPNDPVVPGTDTCEGPSEQLSCDDKKKTYSYYKSSKVGCSYTCYGTSPDSCSSLYDAVKDSQCKGDVVVVPQPDASIDDPIGGDDILADGTIQTLAATSIMQTGAQLNGASKGAFDALGFAFGNKKIAQGVSSKFSYIVSDLKPDTEYTYNTYGSIYNKDVSGSSISFKTLPENKAADARCTIKEGGNNVLYTYPSVYSKACSEEVVTGRRGNSWTGTRSYRIYGKDSEGNCIVFCKKMGDPENIYDAFCYDQFTCINENANGPRLSFNVITAISSKCFNLGYKIIAIGVSGDEDSSGMTKGEYVESLTTDVSKNFDIFPNKSLPQYKFHGWVNYDKDGKMFSLKSEIKVLSGVNPAPVSFEIIANCN